MLDLSNPGFAQAFHQGIFDVAQNAVHAVHRSPPIEGAGEF